MQNFRDLVERRICTPRQEAVQLSHMDEFRIECWKRCNAYLDEQEQVGILALGGGTGTLLDVVSCDVDTLAHRRHRQQASPRHRAQRAHHLGCLPDGIFGSVDVRRRA